MFRCHHRIFLFPYLTLTYPVSAFKQRIRFICSPKFCRTDKLAYQISCVTTDWKTDMETWFFQFIFINVIQNRITAPCPVLILKTGLCKSLAIPDRKKHIAVLKCKISRTCPGSSASSGKIRMFRLHGIHTAHSGDHRNSQNIYKFLKIIHCTCKTYSISRKQNRATAFFYLVQNLLNDIL